jgi:hypothetical protein
MQAPLPPSNSSTAANPYRPGNKQCNTNLLVAFSGNGTSNAIRKAGYVWFFYLWKIDIPLACDVQEVSTLRTASRKKTRALFIK